MNIYGIGHGTTPINEFIGYLKANSIDTLVDVRTKPYSRYNPQFNRHSLSGSLTDAGIKYEWRGNNLGGLGANINEKEAVCELVERAENGEHIVLCCSETDKTKCHRHSKLAPQFKALGLTFVNIEKTKPNTVEPPQTSML